MKKVLTAVTLTLSSGLALAATPSHFYLTPSIGQSSYDVDQEALDDLALFAFEEAGLTVIDADSSLDDTGTSWSLVGGWQFSKYFAAEVGYLDLGKAKYDAAGTVFVPGFGLADATFGTDVSVKGPTVALAGTLPLGERFDIHGRAGVLFAKSKFDFSASLDGESVSDSFDASSKDPFFGIGAAYHFTDRLAATLDYTLYKDVGDEDETGEADLDSATLGVTFRF